jgi:hypothetical protein
VRTGDLVRLFGWTVDEARAEVVRLLSDYGGDIEVDDDGVIWFVFPSFADGGATPSPPIWERDAWSPRRYDDSNAGAGIEAIWLQIGAVLGLVALACIAWIEPGFYKLDTTFSVPRWLVDGVWWGVGAALVMTLVLLAPRAMIVASRQRAWEARRPWQLFLEQLLSSPEWLQGAWVAAQTPNAWLAELGAEIDAERGDGDKLWVNLPEL